MTDKQSPNQTSGDDHSPHSRRKHDPEILALADLALASLHFQGQTPRDDFEAYAYQLKAHIYHHPERFRERFCKGYEQLMEMLNQSQDESLEN